MQASVHTSIAKHFEISFLPAVLSAPKIKHHNPMLNYDYADDEYDSDAVG